MLRRYAKKMRSQRRRNRVMVGRSFLQKSYADITGATIDLKLALCDFTMFTGLLERTKVEKRKRPQPYVGRSLLHRMEMKLRFGVTGSRHVPLCT